MIWGPQPPPFARNRSWISASSPTNPSSPSVPSVVVSVWEGVPGSLRCSSLHFSNDLYIPCNCIIVFFGFCMCPSAPTPRLWVHIYIYIYMKSIYWDYLRQAIVQIASLLSSMAWISFHLNAWDSVTSSLTAAPYSFVWMSHKLFNKSHIFFRYQEHHRKEHSLTCMFLKSHPMNP